MVPNTLTEWDFQEAFQVRLGVLLHKATTKKFLVIGTLFWLYCYQISVVISLSLLVLVVGTVGSVSKRSIILQINSFYFGLSI